MKKMFPVFAIIFVMLLSCTCNVMSEKHQYYYTTPRLGFDEYDMVVIAPSVFSATLQPLIDHKNSRDVLTFLKTTEEIYSEYSGRDEPEQIKYFIKDAFETYSIQYVLLVGSADLLPVRYTHIYFEYDYQNYWVFVSDLYYADIYNETGQFASWDTNNNNVFGEYNWSSSHNFDEVDLYPDVYLGRLACVDTNELTVCISKIITYETQLAYTQPWFYNLVTIGGDSLLGDEFHVDEGEFVNQNVIDILTGFNPNRIWASNNKLYNSVNINNAIDNGSGFVFFNGHGNLDLWATHPHENPDWIPYGMYTNAHLNALSNGDMLPIVVSDACYHCTFDVASDCFGWTFVTNPNGGCIAFLGGTDIDVSYGGVDIITKGIERLCVELSTNYQNGDLTFGELWAHALISYISDDMDEIDYITVEEFQPFGDPSLRIAAVSQPPLQPMTPQGPTNGKVGESYTYTTSTTDPENSSVYYKFDWGDETMSPWVGPYDSGEEISLSHSWSEKGDFEIRVLAKDNTGEISLWSDPLAVVMPVNQGVETLQISDLISKFLARFPILEHLVLQQPFIQVLTAIFKQL